MDTRSIAWGDWDGDGDLDLAVGNYGEVNQVYENHAGALRLGFGFGWVSPGAMNTTGIAWGDWDNDGDLDLAVGNDGQANQVYENEGGALTLNVGSGFGWESPDTLATTSLSWGDWDNDGDLDLAVGNDGQANQVYENEGGALTLNVGSDFGWESSDTLATTSLAWGDWDGDGILDLAVGNDGQLNQVYENDGATLNLAWESTGDTMSTRSVTWGDWDGDGDLDLAVGNLGQVNQVYEYDALAETLKLEPGNNFGWRSPDARLTTSIAWGDWDGDGDLDLAIGNDERKNQVYENEGGTTLTLNPANGLGWEETGDVRRSSSIAWGDWDNDGDLDLAAGNKRWFNSGCNCFIGVSQVYQNNDGALALDLADDLGWQSGDAQPTSSVAWGDWDGDGDLDLAVGNWGPSPQPNRIYENDGGALKFDPNNPNLAQRFGWESTETRQTTSLAWGDWDGDGDLDLAVGNGDPVPLPGEDFSNQVYENDGGILKFGPDNPDPAQRFGWESPDEKFTRSVAWGDWDGDGDLDLAVGNGGAGGNSEPVPNQVFENDGGTLLLDPDNDFGWEEDPGDAQVTMSVAWGDWDGDGDLDLAFGNNNAANQVYENDAETLKLDPDNGFGWISPAIKFTQAVAWGDWDGDDDLDLAVGNQPKQIYENDGGTLKLDIANGFGWESLDSTFIRDLDWGDWDGDGDLDLAVGNWRGANQIYQNDGETFKLAWESTGDELWTYSVAWGDWDNDGDLDLAVGNGGDCCYQPNQVYENPRLGSTHLANNPSGGFVHRPGETDDAFFHSTPHNLETTVIPVSYSLSDSEFDQAARVQGFYAFNGAGQWFPALATTDTVTTNLTTATPPTGTTHLYYWDTFASGFFGHSDNVVFRLDISSQAGPFQHSKATVYSPPFRVRGTQVRVVDETEQPVQEAIVYRLPTGQTTGGRLMPDDKTPFRTSSLGYLEGRGELRLGDQLIALRPIEQNEKYRLFYTSAAPDAVSLDAFTVSRAGVQTLTVSALNPLLLFDLDVSLEWDAGNDPGFLTRLEQNLAKTSAALYDWTNGQAALGRVAVYQAKERWAEADIRIFASNQVHPIANRGGILTQTTVLSFTKPFTAGPGEIRIGPTWNRYGEPEPIGDDWPRVLAHELGHYALFLEDTYLGLDQESGLLIPIDTCLDKAMGDPYDDASSEFHYDPLIWQEQCSQTLAEMPEWDIITQVYPDLHKPPPGNIGPTILPFVFTDIEIKSAPSSPTPLLTNFNVELGDSAADLSAGRAYLIHPDQSMIDLGRPVLNAALARGAREGDEICIFAPEAFACSTLSNSNPTQLLSQQAWHPEILLSPINTTTLRLQVNDGRGGPVTATIYPNGETPQTKTLTTSVAQTITLNQPAVEVLLDIRGDSPGKRNVTGYATGAGPGRTRGYGGPGRTRGYGGPFTSGDGSVSIFPPQNLAAEVFIVLQTATTLPELPPGLVAIGRAYQVRPSAEVATFEGGSLTFQYLGLDVLLSGAAEESLAVHYWDGATWRRLKTIPNFTQNFASAPLPGPGLYVLTAGQLTPEISDLLPPFGNSNLTHSLTISGHNFMAPLTATLHGDDDGYPLTIVSVNTQTISAQTPADLPPDLYDLTITNAGGPTATLSDAFALYTAQPEACFFDNFKSGLGKWSVSGEWEVVTLADSLEAVTDSPVGSYLNAAPNLTRTTTITSQPFSLVGCTNPILTFRHDYAIANGPTHQDWGLVEISGDDGQTWHPLNNYSGGDGYAPKVVASEWDYVSWKAEVLKLAASGVQTDSTTARLRFSLVVDAVGSDKGWIIDQVMVSDSFTALPTFNLYLPLVLK